MTFYVCSNPSCRTVHKEVLLDGCPVCKVPAQSVPEKSWPLEAAPESRRCRFDLFTPAEQAVRNALIAVEAVGADPRLTDAVSLISAAQWRLADYLEGLPGHPTVPVQTDINKVTPA